MSVADPKDVVGPVSAAVARVSMSGGPAALAAAGTVIKIQEATREAREAGGDIGDDTDLNLSGAAGTGYAPSSSGGAAAAAASASRGGGGGAGGNSNNNRLGGGRRRYKKTHKRRNHKRKQHRTKKHPKRR